MSPNAKSEPNEGHDAEPSDGSALVPNEQLTNFEDVLNKLGGFGKFQVLILVLILSLEIPCAFTIFVPIFVGVPPKTWTCRVNESSEWTLYANESCNCPGDLVAASETSLVAEWKLVCDSAWVSDFITSLQMLGTLFGNLYAGSFSDRYGRKYACLGAALLMLLGQAASALAPNFYVYAVARFLAGNGFAGYILISAIYTMEFHTPEYRQVCGSVGPWGEGVMLLGLLAYLIKPWRSLCWVTTTPFLLLLGFFFLPESPRWLLRNNKVAEAMGVTDTIARVNGKPRGTIQLPTLKSIAKNEIKAKEGTDEFAKVKALSYLDMLRIPELRLTTIYLMTLWFSWSFTYFGISYNIRNMSGDPYLNVVFLGLTDAIGYPAGLLICNRLGRRKSVAFFMTWATVFLVALALFELIVGLRPYPQLLLAFCLVGKFGVSGARGCIRTLTGESYPTSCRAKGSGLGGVAASVAAIVVPQLAFVGSYWPSVPFFVFALVSIMGATVSFLLSETMGKPMKEGNGENSKIVPEQLKPITNGLSTRL